MTKNDKEYWNNLHRSDSSTDPLSIILQQLKGLQDFTEIANKLLPDCITRLEKGRKEIVTQTERTFSDIMNMIDEFNPGEENSTYETAVKICDFYRENIDKDAVKLKDNQIKSILEDLQDRAYRIGISLGKDNAFIDYIRSLYPEYYTPTKLTKSKHPCYNYRHGTLGDEAGIPANFCYCGHHEDEHLKEGPGCHEDCLCGACIDYQTYLEEWDEKWGIT